MEVRFIFHEIIKTIPGHILTGIKPNRRTPSTTAGKRSESHRWTSHGSTFLLTGDRTTNPPENIGLDWIVVGNNGARYDTHVTIIAKLTDGTKLAALSLHEVGARILDKIGFTSAERSDNYLKVCTVQNVIAIDTCRPTAEKKPLQLSNGNMAGATTPARTCLATSQANSKGVVHGIPASVLEDEFRRDL